MQHHISYWETNTFLAPFDVLIIGCGIVGCAAALHCATTHPQLRIGVIERGALPSGASTKNAGFASFGSISEICKDIDTMGELATLDLIGMRKAGLDTLLKLISPSALDYKAEGGYEVFTSDDEAMYQRCVDTMKRLNAILAPAFGTKPFISDDRLVEKMRFNDIAHVIAHPLEGVLHPGKMMTAFIRLLHEKGIQLMNGFEISEMIEEENFVRLKGKQGIDLQARHVIVATNAYALQLLPDLPLKPARNQVYVTTPVPELALRGCCYYDSGYIYFRQVDKRVLIGGARNIDMQNEFTLDHGLTEIIKERLMRFLRQHILTDAAFEIDQSWSGIIGVGDQKSPVIRMVSNRIAVAVRLSGMGVAIGSLVGAEVSRLILARL